MTEQDNRKIGKHQNTGWAIAAAITLSFIFYVIYRILFSLVVSAYASYDPSFGAGLGAFVLLGPGPSVLAMLSGATTAKNLFPRANTTGLFYGMSTFMIVAGGLQILGEIGRPDASLLIIIILSATIFISIAAIRFVLIDEE